MLPITINTSKLEVAIIGNGFTTERKQNSLVESGASDIRIFKEIPHPDDLLGIDIVFIAGFSDKVSEEIAKIAKEAGAIVNVEDKNHLCDFHMPAVVRRGDLLLTASTGGKSPRLAHRIREKLEEIFDEKWKNHIEEIGKMREEWLKNGIRFEALSQKTDEFITKEKWL